MCLEPSPSPHHCLVVYFFTIQLNGPVSTSFYLFFFLQSVRITYKYVKMKDEKVGIFNLLLEVVIELTQLAPYIYIRITDLFYLIYIFFPIFRKNIWLDAKENWESTFTASHLPGYSPPSFVRVSNVTWVCSFSEFYFSFL